MVTKPPPEVLTTEKLSFMSTLSEYQRRRFLATEALALGRRGVEKVSQFVGASKNTLYNGIKEIKALIPRHPEWIDTFKLVIAPQSELVSESLHRRVSG